MTESVPEQPRCTGTVKWFNAKKGYGFITPSEGEEEVFVHQSDIEVKGFRSLLEGSEVEYAPVRGPDERLKATHVTGPSGSPPKCMQTGPKPFLPPRGRQAPQQVPMPYPFVYPYPGPQPGMYAGVYPSAQGIPPQPFPGGYGSAAPPGQVMAPGAFPGGPYYGMPGVVMPGPHHLPVAGRQLRRSAWRVVVHNLPWETASEELREAFGAWSPEDAHVMKDRRTGYSKGYGVVGFASRQDMDAAIQGMHGATMGTPGRIVSVRQDQFI